MKVVRSHKTPMTRQVHESVEIEYSSAKIVMNSKGEWNGSRIPRIRIEVGDQLQEEDEESESGMTRATQDKRSMTIKEKIDKREVKKRKDTDIEEGKYQQAKRRKKNYECDPTQTHENT